MCDYKTISADSHVNEPPDLFKDVPAHLKELAPKLIKTDNGDAWVLGPDSVPYLVSAAAVAGRKKEEYLATPVTYETMRPGSYDPAERLKDMDIDGVDADILYPGVMRYTERCANAEVRHAAARAYNEWIADVCKYDPKRLVGVATLPLVDDGDATIEALQHARKLGLGTAFLALRNGGLPLNHPDADRFWAVAEELEMPISVHILTHPFARGTAKEYQSLPGFREMVMSTSTISIAEHVAEVIFSGVFSRHPKLRIVWAECGIGWMPYFLERMDHVFDVHRHYMGSPITELPSEIFRRQCFATFQEDLSGIRLRDVVGVDNIMWASDYPHTDTTWPESQRVIADHFVGIPEEDKHKIVAENAARLYGLI